MDERELLRQGLAAMGLPVPEERQEALLSFMDRVANAPLNLIGPTGEGERVARHLLDSSAALCVHTFREGERVLDIGSGGGLPGISLAITCPQSTFVLMDSIEKKTAFLTETAKALGLPNIKVWNCRAEEAGQDPARRESFDTVTVRAVAPLRVLCEYAFPLLKTGGILLAYKGPRAEEELAEATNAIDLLGGAEATIEKIDIPFADRATHMVVLQKSNQTPQKYPRRVGKPAKNPL
jgi:16S rRNA (guanine527-N7)-methyltransferase